MIDDAFSLRRKSKGCAVGNFHQDGAWVQTGAPINHGKNDGSLVNRVRQVVGFNILKLIKKETNGLGFAPSARDLLDVLVRLLPGGSHSRIERPRLAPLREEPRLFPANGYARL